MPAVNTYFKKIKDPCRTPAPAESALMPKLIINRSTVVISLVMYSIQYIVIAAQLTDRS